MVPLARETEEEILSEEGGEGEISEEPAAALRGDLLRKVTISACLEDTPSLFLTALADIKLGVGTALAPFLASDKSTTISSLDAFRESISGTERRYSDLLEPIAPLVGVAGEAIEAPPKPGDLLSASKSNRNESVIIRLRSELAFDPRAESDEYESLKASSISASLASFSPSLFMMV